MILDIGVGEQPRGDINLDLKRTPYCNIVGCAEHLPFRANSFERVLCYSLIEHLHDIRLGLREIERVSKRYVELVFPRAFLTNNSVYRLLELICNFPFVLTPSYLRLFVRWQRAERNLDPRFHHKNIITLSWIRERFQVNSIETTGDILLTFLKSGRKGQYFKWMPKFNTSYMLKCAIKGD
jgi:SAM-dependent methyltransferase